MSEKALGSVEDIDLQLCQSKLDRGALLLDVRNKDEWDAGHAPQAFFMPLPQLKGNTVGSLNELRNWMQQYSSEDDDPEVVVVCRSGQRSREAARILLANGIRACNLAGGMKAWAAAGLEIRSESGADPKII